MSDAVNARLGSFPRLVGDVGGTNARLALETSPQVFELRETFAVREFARFQDVLANYLNRPAVARAAGSGVKVASLAFANPITGDQVKMTNANWAFSVEEVRKAFDLDVLFVMNDFAALAMSLPCLPQETLTQVGGTRRVEGKVVGLVGAGTGLGVSGLVPCGKDWVPLETEGGHVSFSPIGELERGLLKRASQLYGHVSAERFISGSGLELIYRLLAESEHRTVRPLAAPEISLASLDGTDMLCDRAVEVFCQMLGTVAGNLALGLGARGGVFIGGGMVPRLGARFCQSGFRKRFEEKGRFSGYVADIPVFVINEDYATLRGVSVMTDRHLYSRART